MLQCCGNEKGVHFGYDMVHNTTISLNLWQALLERYTMIYCARYDMSVACTV